jgi:hypothetical protein
VQPELAITSCCRDFEIKWQRNTSQNHLKYEKVQAELALTYLCRDLKEKWQKKSQSNLMYDKEQAELAFTRACIFFHGENEKSCQNRMKNVMCKLNLHSPQTADFHKQKKGEIYVRIS